MKISNLPLAVLALALTACPLRAADHPTRDGSEAADGDTGTLACEDELAKIRALEDEIALLKAAK